MFAITNACPLSDGLSPSALRLGERGLFSLMECVGSSCCAICHLCSTAGRPPRPAHSGGWIQTQEIKALFPRSF